MKTKMIVNRAIKTIRENSPVILSGLGVTGVLTTSYLTAKASMSAARAIDLDEDKRHHAQRARATNKEKLQLVWKLYIPATASGVFTIVCIVGGTRIGMKKAAAAYSILAASEKAFEEYRVKVTEKFGERKEQEIRDLIAQDRVNGTSAAIVIGTGPVHCHEMFTDRVFMSDMETLRAAQNTINEKLNKGADVSLDDFYYLVGLETTSASGYQGWSSDRQLELRFSTVLREKRPCLSFDYNYIHPF